MTSYVKAFAIAKNEDMKFIPGFEALIAPDKDLSKNYLDEKITFLNKEVVNNCMCKEYNNCS